MHFIKSFIILYLFALVSLSTYSQGVARLGVKKLKKENDSLVINYRLEISKKMIETGQKLQIKPMIQAGDSIFVLPQITVMGKNKQKVFSRFDKKNIRQFIPANNERDTIINYNIKTAYTPWMDSASLVLMQEVQNYRGKNILTVYEYKSSILAVSPRNNKIDFIPSFILPQVAERHQNIKSVLNFEHGHSVISPIYMNNHHELDYLHEEISKLKKNPQIVLETIYIVGYASPDGNYFNNAYIAQKRALALKAHLISLFDLDDSVFKVSIVPEDWDGLIEIVKKKEISGKDDILNIITSENIGYERNRKLLKFSNGDIYHKHLSDILPSLRRVECLIHYALRNNLADEKYSFSEDSIANNNAAAVMIRRSKIDEAKIFLDKAGNTSAALNNRGIISILEGDINQAEDYFIKAGLLDNKEAVYNLKQLQIKQRKRIESLINE